MKTPTQILTLSLALIFSLSAAPAPAAGQDLDTRWLPWIGCWETADVPRPDILCVRPGPEASTVEIVRVSGSEVVAREVVWADRARHETNREGCDGWESGFFSEDGRRLITRSEHRCADGATREAGGIMAMAAPDEWLDVRVAGMGGERTAWVQRYLPVSTERLAEAGVTDPSAELGWNNQTARALAASPIDVDDVVEVARILPTEAVQAFLVERGDPLDLDAAQLVRMSEAGVPDEVIDVAVAVSFPDRFVVSADGDVGRSALDEGSLRRRPRHVGYGTPLFFDPFYYDRYGYGYGRFYGGYPGYYGYGGYYGYRPSVIVVDRPDPDHGRVVKGRGYTRSGAASGSRGTSRASGASRSSGAARTSGATRSGSSTASPARRTSSSPPSRGSSSSSGRTAKRRGGGE